MVSSPLSGSRLFKHWPIGGAVVLALGLLISLRGCTAISIAPTCPSEMRVGDSRDVTANEENPGAIARYLWEAIPADAGTFANPRTKDTRFQALKEGEVTLRLTASDGLYQAVSDCRTTVQGFVGVAVRLTADPEDPRVREPVTLTCESVGATEAVVLDIVQIDGGLVELNEVSEGVVRFESNRIGDLEFRCVGENAAGEQSEPTFVTVNITGGGNQNGNANGNQNANTNDNSDDTQAASNDNAEDQNNDNSNGR